ncbi:hypothetical protein LR48_Vigan04g127500 [Vigna angularis]|uniref:Uncharacterized protein n=1 Tax=Phaseolus angularis TaxID=3914 RepID=A0A0L9UEV7_PHAAN|nr:hypothetical protein LR48_Vigan04g127500 [Vigna angularis]
MASSSHPSIDRGKVVVAARNADLSRWISDEETRLEFLRWTKFKHIVPHKYLNLDLFEKEEFHFQEWFETQGVSTLVQMKGDWCRDLVRVFYNNMRNIDGVLHSQVKGVNVHIDNDVWFQLVGLKVEGLLSHFRKILTLQGVDVSGEKKCFCNCSNVTNRNTLTSIGLVKTTKGWCFKDEENMVQSSGSIPALNEDCTNFVPETNFERFVVEKLRRLEQKIDALHEKKNKNDSPIEDSSEESSEEDSMEIF